VSPRTSIGKGGSRDRAACAHMQTLRKDHRVEGGTTQLDYAFVSDSLLRHRSSAVVEGTDVIWRFSDHGPILLDPGRRPNGGGKLQKVTRRCAAFAAVVARRVPAAARQSSNKRRRSSTILAARALPRESCELAGRREATAARLAPVDDDATPRQHKNRRLNQQRRYRLKETRLRFDSKCSLGLRMRQMQRIESLYGSILGRLCLSLVPPRPLRDPCRYQTILG
jgi:hypothetical protein